MFSLIYKYLYLHQEQSHFFVQALLMSLFDNYKLEISLNCFRYGIGSVKNYPFYCSKILLKP